MFEWQREGRHFLSKPLVKTSPANLEMDPVMDSECSSSQQLHPFFSAMHENTCLCLPVPPVKKQPTACQQPFFMAQMSRCSCARGLFSLCWVSLPLHQWCPNYSTKGRVVPALVPTRQQHTRLDSFKQLIWVFRQQVGQTLCAWLVGAKIWGHTALCGMVWPSFCTALEKCTIWLELIAAKDAEFFSFTLIYSKLVHLQ